MVNFETLKAIQEIDAARSAVEPVVGKLAMSFDSADQVYIRALKALGYTNAGRFRGQGKAAKVAFEIMRARPASARRPAMDARAISKRSEMFPNANRLSGQR